MTELTPREVVVDLTVGVFLLTAILGVSYGLSVLTHTYVYSPPSPPTTVIGHAFSGLLFLSAAVSAFWIVWMFGHVARRRSGGE